jgi:hypothetical protein
MGNETENLFSGLMEHRSSKIVTILISLMTMILTTPFLLGIIWYQFYQQSLKKIVPKSWTFLYNTFSAFKSLAFWNKYYKSICYNDKQGTRKMAAILDEL